jgi:hypothetical protein
MDESKRGAVRNEKMTHQIMRIEFHRMPARVDDCICPDYKRSSRLQNSIKGQTDCATGFDRCPDRHRIGIRDGYVSTDCREAGE